MTTNPDSLMPCVCGGFPKIDAVDRGHSELSIWHIVYCTSCDIRTDDCTDPLIAAADWNHTMSRADLVPQAVGDEERAVVMAAKELVDYINRTAAEKELTCKNAPDGFFPRVRRLEEALQSPAIADGVGVDTGAEHGGVNHTCPCCGCLALLRQRDVNDGTGDYFTLYRMECDTCGTRSKEDDNLPMVVKCWNLRPTSTPPQAATDEG